jgi:PTH2 family peptidyl-tRNA hydrolase
MDLETAKQYYENTEIENQESEEDWYSFLGNPVMTLGVGMLCGVVANFLSRAGGGPARETLNSSMNSSCSMGSFAAAANILTGPYKMVLLVRTDLGMQKGKVAAQCAHAALACYKKALKNDPDGVTAWEITGQTKVCLKVDNEEAMLNLAGVAKVHGLTWSIVRDAGRTQVSTGTMTVLGIGPNKVDQIDKITGHLKLY